MLLTIHWCYSQFIHWCYFLVLFIGATHEVSLVLLLTIHWCYLRFIHWCYSRSFIGAATHNLLAIACVVVKKNEASNTLCGQTQQEIQPPSHTNTHTLQSHAAPTPTATYLNEGVRKRFHFFPPWTAFHRNPSPLVKIPRGRRVPIATTVDVITNTAAAAAAAAATAFCRHDIRLLPRMLGAASVYSA